MVDFLTSLGYVAISDVRKRIVKKLAKKSAYFNELRDELGLTDDNLVYHLMKLQADGIVEQERRLYILTKMGRRIAKTIESMSI
jgi:predicted transcriptional regulator